MALIGVSGKKGHGKDLVANIINSFIQGKRQVVGVGLVQSEDYRQPFEIKRFADKLKDMVCMLLGCTRKQLEDREFKEKELGEEWVKYKIVNLYGDKTTPIEGKYFSTKKEARLFEQSREEYEQTGGYDTGIGVEKMTPRKILQLLGTEAGRNIIHPNIWVNALMSGYKRPSHWEDRYYDEVNKKGFSGREEVWGDLPNWIIPDMRFPNELAAVKSKGGITIRVNRPSVESNDNHESETALDNATFDHVIVNDGTIEELIDKVKEVLIKEKVID